MRGGLLAASIVTLRDKPASTNAAYSLTVDNANASEHGLRVGLVWWIIGMALALCYTTFLYRSFAGKVSSGESGEKGDY